MAMTGGIAKLLHTGIPDYGADTKYPIKLYAYYKYSQSNTLNQTTMKLGMYVESPSGYNFGPWGDYNGSYIGTDSMTFDGSITKGSGKRWLVENKTLTIQHDDSTGKATAKIKWKWGVNSPWGQFVIPSGSFEVPLPTIPRASTVGATDANIGSNTSIGISRKSELHDHSLAFQFGSKKGYLTADGMISDTEVRFDVTSMFWQVPTSFYAEIPNAKSGKCALTVTTYSEDTQIGDPQTSYFTVTASRDTCAPVVSGKVEDSNETSLALTGDAGRLVRYRSTALCTISVEPRNGATISGKQINGAVVSGDTYSIPAVELSAVPFYAVDSRGYDASTQVEFELIPYVPLTNNAEATRVNPGTGTSMLTLQGNYFNDSFGAVENALTLRYSVDGGDYIDVEPLIAGDGYTATVEIPDLDYTTSHAVDVVAADLLDTVPKTVTIGKSIPMVFRNEDLYGFTTNIVATRFVKMGSTWITPTAANTPTEGEVIFTEPFDAEPIVTLGVVSNAPGTAVLGATIKDVTASGFKIWLARADTVRTLIHWIAVYQPANPLERSTYSMRENNTGEGESA